MLNEALDVYDVQTTAQYRDTFSQNPSKRLVVDYQSEDSTTYSIGSWAGGCGVGYRRSESLFCNGFLAFKSNRSADSIVLIKGRIYNQSTNTVPQEVVGKQINICQATMTKPVIDPAGNFSFNIAKGRSFCIRPPVTGLGNVVAVNKALVSRRSTSYEGQVADFACTGDDKYLPVCSTSILSLTEDRDLDDGYDLVYK